MSSDPLQAKYYLFKILFEYIYMGVDSIPYSKLKPAYMELSGNYGVAAEHAIEVLVSRCVEDNWLLRVKRKGVPVEFGFDFNNKRNKEGARKYGINRINWFYASVIEKKAIARGWD